MIDCEIGCSSIYVVVLLCCCVTTLITSKKACIKQQARLSSENSNRLQVVLHPCMNFEIYTAIKIFNSSYSPVERKKIAIARNSQTCSFLACYDCHGTHIFKLIYRMTTHPKLVRCSSLQCVCGTKQWF